MNRFQLSGALLVGAAFAVPSSSHAQTVPAKQTAKLEQPATQTTLIKLRNIPSQLVAYWLAPHQNPMPTQLLSSAKNGDFRGGLVEGLPREPGNALGPRDLKLPVGITTVVSNDPQNVLLVKGSEAGVKELQKLVEQLDVPIHQTEIEVQFMELAPDDLKALPLDFRTNSYPQDEYFAKIAVANFPSATKRQLDELVQSGRAKIITAPRVTASDGLTTQLVSTESRALDLNETPTPDKNDEDVAAKTDNWRAGLTRIQDQTGIRTKSVSKGDLIVMDLEINLQGQAARVSAIVNNGQMLAVRLPQDDPQNGNARIALVTARMIRRAGD